MKKAAAVVLVLALGLIAWHFMGARSPVPATLVTPVPPTVAAPETAPAAATVTEVPPSSPATVIGQNGSPGAMAASVSAAASNTLVSSLPPLTVLDNARVAIHNYASVFGENPVGENSEITAALRGKNPKQINFISEESGLKVNEKGELVDAWGTPFFFHQLSGHLMEIHSAGEDKKMWTYDDLVTR